MPRRTAGTWPGTRSRPPAPCPLPRRRSTAVRSRLELAALAVARVRRAPALVTSRAQRSCTDSTAASDFGGIPYFIGSNTIGSRNPPHFEGVVRPGLAVLDRSTARGPSGPRGSRSPRPSPRTTFDQKLFRSFAPGYTHAIPITATSAGSPSNELGASTSFGLAARRAAAPSLTPRGASASDRRRLRRASKPPGRSCTCLRRAAPPRARSSAPSPRA